MSARQTSRAARDRHEDEGRFNKFFHLMLNMADDDLDPFEYRLLGHYIRVCGQAQNGVCFQTVRTISDTTKMSIPKVIAARNALAKSGWIRVEARANKTHNITIVDRMAENVNRYTGQDIEHPGEELEGDQNIDHADQDIDRGDQNPAYEEEPIKKNTQEEPESKASAVTSTAEPPAETPTKPLTPHQRMFEAVCSAWGYNVAALTKSKRGQINAVVGELTGANATPDDMPAFKAWLDKKAAADEWRSYTVSAMAKYWPDYDAERNAPPPAPVVWDYGDQTQDQVHDEIIANFRAKLATPGAFDAYLTPEERAAQAAQATEEKVA